MGKYFFKLFVFSVSSFLSCSLLAYKCIDVDEFSGDGKRGIRVCVFDTDRQEFDHISYYPAIKTKSRSTSGNLYHTYHGLVVSYDGKVSVARGYDLTNFIIRAPEIYFPDGQPKDGVYVGGVWPERLHKKITIRSGDYIFNDLNRYQSPSQNPAFNIFFHMFNRDTTITYFSNIFSNRKDNNAERGRLGELATELTMLSYGYYAHPSKYRTDNGIDGVYEDKSPNRELFLTESKCREESKSTGAYMKRDLSESHINTCLVTMRTHADVRDTATLIQSYISSTPEKIFKFVHRIKPNGQAQCLVEKFNSMAYSSLTLWQLTPASSSQSKKRALEALAASLFPGQKVNLQVR